MANVHYLEKGEGPTVVFLHGIGADCDSFAFQLEAFAQAGYHAVSWDMPGYGRSLPLTPMTFPGLAQSLQQLLEELNVSLCDNSLFVFTNRHQNRIKLLYWDKTGFALWLKRLEKSCFRWPKNLDKNVIELSSQQLSWLLEGDEVTKL